MPEADLCYSSAVFGQGDSQVLVAIDLSRFVFVFFFLLSIADIDHDFAFVIAGLCPTCICSIFQYVGEAFKSQLLLVMLVLSIKCKLRRGLPPISKKNGGHGGFFTLSSKMLNSVGERRNCDRHPQLFERTFIISCWGFCSIYVFVKHLDNLEQVFFSLFIACHNLSCTTQSDFINVYIFFCCSTADNKSVSQRSSRASQYQIDDDDGEYI